MLSMAMPNELRITGTLKRGIPGWRLGVGQDVPSEAGAYLQALLTQPCYSTLSYLRGDQGYEPFLDDLVRRGTTSALCASLCS